MAIAATKPALDVSTFAMPDGRSLYLYGAFTGKPHWAPLEEAHEKGFSHRRWHPVRREWVVYSAHRQTRTYKPATDACPLCPMALDGEIPVEDFSIAVFDNRFSSLQKDCPNRRRCPGSTCRSIVPREIAKSSSIPPITRRRWRRYPKSAVNFW